jgi:hypothetical protein
VWHRRPQLLALAVVAVAVAGPARSAEPDPAEVERDALIDRIAAGSDYDASVRRFAELLRARDRVKATSEAARKREADELAEARAARATVAASLDGRLAHSCRIVTEPRDAPFSTHAWDELWLDWGKVTRSESVKIPGENALAEDTTVHMIEVAGRRRTYRIADEKRAIALAAGDLAVVCATQDADHDPAYRHMREKIEGPSVEDRLPAAWRGIEHHGPLVARVREVPHIATKARWHPVHVTDNDVWWAIRDVKWRWPDRDVVTFARVAAALGGGLYEMEAEDAVVWLMEVPSGVDARAITVGKGVWAVLGNARFDRARKKLVLTAVDLEPSYFIP